MGWTLAWGHDRPLELPASSHRHSRDDSVRSQGTQVLRSAEEALGWDGALYR